LGTVFFGNFCKHFQESEVTTMVAHDKLKAFVRHSYKVAIVAIIRNKGKKLKRNLNHSSTQRLWKNK
jgi:hypothetical protein